MPFVMLTSLPVDTSLSPSQALVVFALRVVGAGFVLWLLSVAVELVRGISGSESSTSEGSTPVQSAEPITSMTSTAAAPHAPQSFAAPGFAPQAFAPQGLDDHTLAAIAVALELESLGAGTPAHEAGIGLSPWAHAGRARQMRKR